MKLIVYNKNNLVFSLLMKNNELLDLKVDNLIDEEHTSSIFLGKIKSISPGVEGYFLDIGLKKDGYLPYSESDKMYKVGDYVVVQIKKEPTKFKGAKLTTKLSFKGKYIIYYENSNFIKFSHLFEDGMKDYYLDNISKLLRENEGIIIRTQAKNAKLEQIESEIEYFRKKLKCIKDISYKSIMTLEPREPYYISMTKDYWYNLEKVIVSDLEAYKKISDFVLSQGLDINIELAIDVEKLENFFEIQKNINRLLNKYVWLESGGFLVIEETEAMTTIDVNSGKNNCDCIESSSFSTNVEAALEIPKQMKLRNMGGIIMIDFIFMKDQKHRKEVLDILKEGFSKDNIQTVVYGYTALGLVEIARKKVGRSISQNIKTASYENTPILF